MLNRYRLQWGKLRLKKWIIGFLILTVFLCSNTPVYASPPSLKASSVILMDFDSGRILYEHNSQVPRSQASTTKITTAIVALQAGGLDQMVTISQHAADTGEAGINLRAGEQLTLRQLIQALLVYSANDAAVAIAEHVGDGRVDKFVEQMNLRARQIGATRTHYVNPHGLDTPGHYSTARDLAVLARYAIAQVPGFDEIIGLKEIQLNRQGFTKPQIYHNRNKLLSSYIGADGVKTGTTDDAGKCLVSSATRQGHRLIGVVLNSPDVYSESAQLLDYGFKNFKYVKAVEAHKTVASARVVYGKLPEVPLSVSKTIVVPINLDGTDKLEGKVRLTQQLEAPIASKSQVGTYQVWLNDKLYQDIPVYADKTIKRQTDLQIFWNKLISWFRNLF